jgi:hypothetical protein
MTSPNGEYGRAPGAGKRQAKKGKSQSGPKTKVSRGAPLFLTLDGH